MTPPITELFKKLCMEPTNRITYVSRPKGKERPGKEKEFKKPGQDIMLFVNLIQKKRGDRI